MEKRILLSGFIVCIVFCGNIIAQQLPSISTASNPKWYYIQALGSGVTANRVAMAIGDKVEGGPVLIDNVSTMSTQLWRFELAGNGYVVINKSTGKKLSVAYDPLKNSRIATVSDNPSTLWRFVRAGSGYNIRMITEPAEGLAGAINLYQTNASQNYALIFAGTAESSTDNACFNFVLSENPAVSTEMDIVWMHVKNAKTGKYLTDAVSSAQDKACFSVDDLKNDGNDASQHWKLIAKAGGSMDFVNRATGNPIPTNTVFDRYYYLLYTHDSEESAGWNLTSLGKNQYAIYTISPEGALKYWYATTPGEPAIAYTEGYVQNTPYAWFFSWADEERTTGIDRLLPEENIRVYSYGKRIYVEGCESYKITSLYGIPVHRNENLPAGIYLVTVKSKTVKLLVK